MVCYEFCFSLALNLLMGMMVIYLFCCLLLAAALRSLMDQWDNTPPSWGGSDDPCGTPWEGVSCNDSRITAL